MFHLINAASRAGQVLFTTVKTWATGNTIKLLGRETWNSMRIILVLLILCGVIYPLILFGVGQLAFKQQANGSLVTDAHGRVIGSTLLGQQFTRPEYFHGRPSAVGYYESSKHCAVRSLSRGGSPAGQTARRIYYARL